MNPSVDDLHGSPFRDFASSEPHSEPPDLVFTQNPSGEILSFSWPTVELHSLQPQQVVGTHLGEHFGPQDLVTYWSRVQRVLEGRVSERFQCTFHDRQGQRWLFEIVITPVLLPNADMPLLLVIGQYLGSASQLTTQIETLSKPSATALARLERYQKLYYQKVVTQIAWNIRRTMDLATIWQQTAEGLGTALGVRRCLVCPYQQGEAIVKVVAEYCDSSLPSLLGQELELTTDLAIAPALQTNHLIVLDSPATAAHPQSSSPLLQQESLLVVTTCYQDQPNGLIILCRSPNVPMWSAASITLVRELADHVGTAIAHATLFAETQNLATELRQVNQDLMQKQIELEEARKQAEVASQLKSEFLANTSHELRTPLNGMIGFLKLILDGMAEDPEEQTEFIEEAYRSALHLLNIINDVLDLAKIEAGKLQIDLSPVNLNELLQDVENFTQPSAQQKNLNWQILPLPTQDEIIVYGNYQRLLQVMLNLVGNAIKFTHTGGVTIGVEIKQKPLVIQGKECPGIVKIRVEDTGIGVSLEKQDRLFQSFSQVDGSRTRQYGGTGLGLAISQRLVQAMGGVVNFYSMGEDLGATVTFTIPLYQEPVMISPSPVGNSATSVRRQK
jgi:signal transduction histidine kinase